MARMLKTAQRAAISRFLEGNTSHPTAADIYEAVSRDGTVTSMTTVYNVLSFLEKQGQIQELQVLGGEGRRFDPNPAPHDHLICRGCHRVIDIDLSCNFTINEEQRRGFAILGVSICVYGLCPTCQEAGTGSSPERTEEPQERLPED